MIRVVSEIEGISPISWSRRLLDDDQEKPRDNETKREWQERIWRDKAYSKDGQLYVPAAAVNFAIKATAQRMGIKVPGKGNNLYTKHFLTGVHVPNPMFVGAEKDIRPEYVMCDPQGKRPSKSQVLRIFPILDNWAGKVEFIVADTEITEQVFSDVWEYCGVTNGFGRYRPGNGGNLGMFQVKSIKWISAAKKAA